MNLAEELSDKEKLPREDTVRVTEWPIQVTSSHNSSAMEILSAERSFWLEWFQDTLRKYSWSRAEREIQWDLSRKLHWGSLPDSLESAASLIQHVNLDITGESPIPSEGIPRFVHEHFPEKLLKWVLISEIRYQFDTVSLLMPRDNPLNLCKGVSEIPEWEFLESWGRLSTTEQEIIRPMIFSWSAQTSWHLEGLTRGKYYPTPIVINNLKHTKKFHTLQNWWDLRKIGLEYMGSVPDELRMMYYVYWTTAHEVGHHLYAYQTLGTSIRKKWEDIVHREWNITQYAKACGDENGYNYDENFAEAVALYVTCAEYLRDNYPSAFEFVRINFPEIWQMK